MTRETPETLVDLIRRRAAAPTSAAIHVLTEHARALHGPAVQAVLFYGSCLRSGDDRGGMVDLYVIVDRYRNAHRSHTEALLNRVLPPSVFYLEAPVEGRVTRAKYAVLSLADLERGTSRAWFHSYLWGRFAQPCALLYARSPAAAERVHAALAQAVLTFLARVVPCLPSRFGVRELWLRGLTLSYAAELRAERPGKMVSLFESWADFFAEVTEAALPGLPFACRPTAGDGRFYESHIADLRRWTCRWAWRVRSVQGKILHVLRLAKGAFTFAGGADYILWKIERHTGVALEVPARLRRHPILAICVLSWRLYRRGGFR